jgi:hypothetical protein
MFGKFMHPTLELCLVLVVISSLFVAQSSMIVHVATDKSKDSYLNKGDGKYNFAVALLVVAVLVLVYGLSFLGMDLYEKYSK